MPFERLNDFHAPLSRPFESLVDGTNIHLLDDAHAAYPAIQQRYTLVRSSFGTACHK
jgi:hypothetical protein